VPWRKPTPADVTAALALVPQDLRWQPEPLPDDRNALLLWRRAVARLVPPEDEGLEESFYGAMSPEKPEDFPTGERRARLDEWLSSNDEALVLVDEGAALGQCRFDITIGEQPGTSILQGLRQVARIRRVRAGLAAADGNFERACDELVKGLRMADMVTLSEGAPLHFLMGLAYSGIAREGVRDLAAVAECPATTLERLISALPDQAEAAESLAEAMKIEFGYVAAALQANPGRAKLYGQPSLPVFDDGSDFMGIAIASFRTALKSIPISWGERLIRLTPKLQALNQEYDYFVQESFMAHVAPAGGKEDEEVLQLAKDISAKGGPMYQALLTRMLESWLEKLAIHRADRAATRAVLALRLFETRNGRLPERLEELVAAGILDEVPVDPFCEKPLRYSRDRRRVWSVGPDESDDGGRDDPGVRRTNRDYVFEVPGAPAP
jgi:hypothetical protein